MVDWVRRALTRNFQYRTVKGKRQGVQVQPNETLVYGLKFAISMTICLSGIEIASVAFLHTWNSEVFTAISGLIGLVTGIFMDIVHSFSARLSSRTE
jgi:hypothetical protein